MRISSPHKGLRKPKGGQPRSTSSRDDGAPCCFIHEVAKCFLLISNDVDNGMTTLPELLQHVAILLALDDTSSASDDHALGMLSEQLAKDDSLGVAKSSPTVLYTDEREVSRRSWGRHEAKALLTKAEMEPCSV